MAALLLEVSQAQGGRTVKSLLKGELGLSTALIGRLKRTVDGLTVNEQRVFTNAILSPGDRLRVNLDAAERPTGLQPAPMALDILFEDEHLLVVNKPAPLASIPSSLSPGEPSLAAGLLHHLGDGGAVHLVNRLDRGTTGLLAAAKNGYVHNLLRRQLHSGAFSRSYLALCVGTPSLLRGRVELPIGRAEGSAICRQVDPAGKPAVTDYRVLGESGGLSLLELIPHTGRTHQLRVHAAALGCPLAGDWLYGTEDPALIRRPALHAAHLTLIHPLTGVQLALTAPLPEDMKQIFHTDQAQAVYIEKLRER